LITCLRSLFAAHGTLTTITYLLYELGLVLFKLSGFPQSYFGASSKGFSMGMRRFVLDSILLSARNKKRLRNNSLDFLLVENLPEGFSAALVETDRELCSFSFLVRLTSHFPGFFRVFNFFSTFRAFCHSITLS